MNIEKIKLELNNINRTSFGISIPELKKLAKKIAKEDYYEFINSNPNDTFELRLLNAFVIGYIKTDIKSLLEIFQNFIPFVNHWAINDSLCQNFKIAKKEQAEVWNFLLKLKDSKKEFESRIVAVMLLSHFLNDEYIDKVIDILDSLNTDDYYSQMGVAWAFATITGKYPKKCLDYLKSNNLDKKTYNKTLQKIRESYKVSNEIKKIVKEIKHD